VKLLICRCGGKPDAEFEVRVVLLAGAILDRAIQTGLLMNCDD
jgi:hypothetical protein